MSSATSATSSAVQPDTELTRWERVGTQSEMGRYITGIERNMILWAETVAGVPEEALEVGCEGGRWSKALADNGWRMTCTDVNEQALEQCRQRVPSARCLVVDPNEPTLPCADASLKLILCIEVIDVIESSWFLKEARRVLKPGGVLVATYWNSLSWRGLAYRMARALRPLHDASHFYQGTPYTSFRKRACQSGFDIAREKGFCWLPFSRLSNSPLAPICANIEQVSGLRHLPSLSPWIVFAAIRS